MCYTHQHVRCRHWVWTFTPRYHVTFNFTLPPPPLPPTKMVRQSNLLLSREVFAEESDWWRTWKVWTAFLKIWGSSERNTRCNRHSFFYLGGYTKEQVIYSICWLHWREEKCVNICGRKDDGTSLEAFAATEIHKIFTGRQTNQCMKILQSFRTDPVPIFSLQVGDKFSPWTGEFSYPDAAVCPGRFYWKAKVRYNLVGVGAGKRRICKPVSEKKSDVSVQLMFSGGLWRTQKWILMFH
jgi:hypothetical protein